MENYNKYIKKIDSYIENLYNIAKHFDKKTQNEYKNLSLELISLKENFIDKHKSSKDTKKIYNSINYTLKKVEDVLDEARLEIFKHSK